MLKGFLETEIVFVAEAFGFLTQKRREGEARSESSVLFEQLNNVLSYQKKIE